ncbi:hypothetical protein [Stenotrophomonas sp. 22385]|uniref:hypothetical protein n=1 Tax=Stenotrophomonas sp. 22385 TaxID=3453915 RepID=UPI003F87CD3C
MKRLTLFCLTAVLMTACNRLEPAMSHDLSTAEADVAAGGRGLATLNPEPVKAYQVTLRIHGAPGAFKLVRGTAQYDVINEDQCGNIEPATGTASRITSQEPMELTRISDEEYQGTLYLDRMKDQDYYGRGICRWEFTGAGALLKATGAQEETRFLTFVDAPDLVAGKTYTRYYPLRDYPRAGQVDGVSDVPAIDDYASSGEENPTEYREGLRDSLFSISITAVETAR